MQVVVWQSVSSSGQSTASLHSSGKFVQAPSAQVWIDEHTVPQAPQLAGSELVSTHVSPQSRGELVGQQSGLILLAALTSDAASAPAPPAPTSSDLMALRRDSLRAS